MPCMDDGPSLQYMNYYKQVDKLRALYEYACQINGISLDSVVFASGSIKHLSIALCALLKETNEDLIYNGRIPQARRLADWWDEHKEMDRRREEREKKAAEEQSKVKFNWKPS